MKKIFLLFIISKLSAQEYIVPSATTINKGQSVSMYDSTYSTYLWSNGATTKNISVTPTTTTTYTVTHAIGENQKTATVIINVTQPDTTSKHIGQIFSDNFSRASLGNNYTIGGVASWTCDGSQLITSGGTGVFTNVLKRTANISCLENHTIVVDFKLTSAVNSSSFGLGVGVLSSNTVDKKGYCILAGASSGTYNGKTILYTSTGSGATFSNRKVSSNHVVINQNDSLRLVVIRSENIISWTLFNLTLATSYSDSFTFSLAYSTAPIVPNNTGCYTLYSQGGTISVTKWSVNSSDLLNPKTMFVSHSIGYGAFAGSIAKRWCSQVMDTSLNYVNESGASDKTAEVLSRMPELLSINPKYVVIDVLGNDVAAGVSYATMEANYISIVNQFKAAGITVIHCFPSPRNSYDMTTINAWILSTYGGSDMVLQNTFYNLTTTPGTSHDLRIDYDSGDHVHPNLQGHTAYANAVYGATPFLR